MVGVIDRRPRRYREAPFLVIETSSLRVERYPTDA
jgi:hypothetical protein